ncbi:SET and MYND domain-containing protein 3, partial [Anas platyrhynchos]
FFHLSMEFPSYSGNPGFFPLFSQVTCNCFTISNGEMQDVGVGLYPSMSLLNHSCDPNCVIIFEGYQLLLRSVREIQIGEELTISYIESLMPTSERQKQLMRQYCFECDCHLCQDHEKVGWTKKFLVNKTEFSR